MNILVAEDERITRRTLERYLQQWGHNVTVAEDGQQAWDLFQKDNFDAVLTDWQMPTLSGIELVERIRATPRSNYVYVILLTSKSETKDVIAGLETGADDFLRKPFDRDELRARLNAGGRILSLEKELARRNARMKHDLDAASTYVLSLLPSPSQAPVELQWHYVPATELAGDILGYHWIDDDACAMYLLDVTGHGLDAALLSVTVLNVIRSMSLPATDFRQPDQVIRGLNDRFPMEEHGDRCFSLWYGVYTKSTSQLTWSGGGHPPALYFSAEHPAVCQQLPSSGPWLGMLSGIDFPSQTRPVSEGDRLIIYSDGVYEINRPDGEPWTFEEFVAFTTGHCHNPRQYFDQLWRNAQEMLGAPTLDDDFTILTARF